MVVGVVLVFLWVVGVSSVCVPECPPNKKKDSGFLSY